MKTRQLITLMGILLALITSRSAVLIEYNFDEQETTMSYLDQSGNDRWVKFNRNVSVRTEYPFSAEHPPVAGLPVNPLYPELVGKNKSARTTYNAATSGGVRTDDL